MSSDELFRILVPLKIVLVTERPGPEHAAIQGAITRAFRGGQASAETAEAYFSTGEDLGVAVLEVDFDNGESQARRVVDEAIAGALHCLVVVLLYETPTDPFRAWLTELDRTAQDDSAPRPALSLLPVAIKEGAWRGDTQSLDYLGLGEYALRPVYVAAHVLACAWRALGDPRDRLKLFISHAKLDGLPLALSFKNQLSSLHGLERFYDADNIPPGSNWKRVLRDGVQESVVVALRTNIYEERFWCVQELDWAEDFGCPVIMVEARTSLVRAREFLPVNGSPTVQVPDGNLVRVLQSALREALRIRMFMRQVDALADAGAVAAKGIVLVPRTSLATLGMRCQDRAKDGQSATAIFVSEPFRAAHRPVAAKLAGAYFPDAWLGTVRAWIDATLAKGTV
jgi:hypothetical protein